MFVGVMAIILIFCKVPFRSLIKTAQWSIVQPMIVFGLIINNVQQDTIIEVFISFAVYQYLNLLLNNLFKNFIKIKPRNKHQFFGCLDSSILLMGYWICCYYLMGATFNLI